MSTETTNKKIKIDNGTTFGKTYTDKAIDERLQGLVSTATFTPVQEKANNSLQKPAGLTKTKLVGVGANGQENIEIGDNLTLANGKLSATGGDGGIPVVEGTLTTTSEEGVYDITIPEAQTTNFILHFNFDGADMYALINFVMALGGTGIYKSITDIEFNEQTGAIINYATIDGSGTDLSYVSSNVTNPFTPSKTIYLFGKYSILVPEVSTDTYILPLPSDASTSTYVLKAVNGTVQWVKES